MTNIIYSTTEITYWKQIDLSDPFRTGCTSLYNSCTVNKREVAAFVLRAAAVPVLWSLDWLEKQEWRSWLLCPHSSEDPMQPAIESMDMLAVGQWSIAWYCIVSSLAQPIDDIGTHNYFGYVRTVALKNETPSDLVYLHTQVEVSTLGMRVNSSPPIFYQRYVPLLIPLNIQYFSILHRPNQDK